MLVELVQSILDSINKGSIPFIENSWKMWYRMNLLKIVKI